MKYCSRSLSLAILIALTLAACKPRQPQSTVVMTVEPQRPIALPAPTCPQTVDFVLMQLNDVYEISPMDNGKVAGLARVATVRKQLQDAGHQVITILSGDYLSPSLLGALKCDFPAGKQRVNGRQMVEVMNAIGVDYVTFGNHEFDLKAPDLNARNNESQFQIVSANVKFMSDSGPVPFQQNGKQVPEYAVRRLWNAAGDTMRLGFIGVTLPFNLQPYLQYDDIYASATKAFAAARPYSDVIMGITHLSITQDDTLSQRIPAMPLLMGGHEHQNMLRPVGAAHIAKADANAKTVYLHWCKYHPDTKEIEIFSQLMPITDAIPGDPVVTKIVEKWEDFANNCMKSQGYLPDDTIGYAMAPLDGRDASMRTSQTNVGFSICNAMRTVDPAADLAIINSGSVRIDDQISGVVLQRHVLAMLPFGGNIVHGSMKGSDLRRFLDTGLSKALDFNGAHLQYSSNLSRTGTNYVLNGKPIEDAKIYQVAIPGFLAGTTPGTGETVYNNMGISTWAKWAEPDLKSAKAKGLAQNDIRDIVIFAMKQDPKLKVLLEMMRGH
jgi:2',3'-cyclic-nucleotide 2'-phosphodiesterase (5'-nucleotidase family)